MSLYAGTWAQGLSYSATMSMPAPFFIGGMKGAKMNMEDDLKASKVNSDGQD